MDHEPLGRPALDPGGDDHDAAAGRPPTATGELSPRPGPAGWWDRLVGPGASPAETRLVLATATTGLAAVVGYAVLADPAWSPLQVALVALLALDIAGGVPANSTRSGSAWFHRPGQGARAHLGFVAAHGHPFLLAAAVPGFAWSAAALTYGFVVAAAVLAVAVGQPLRRPVALTLCGAGLVGATLLPGVATDLAWVAPLLLLKLLVAHVVPGPGAGSRPGEPS